jgi:hypothetical protein
MIEAEKSNEKRKCKRFIRRKFGGNFVTFAEPRAKCAGFMKNSPHGVAQTPPCLL